MATFILIHGAWQAAWCWSAVIPRLQYYGHRALAIDLPGHGKDPRRPEEISLGDYVDSIIAVVNSVDSAPILVGHSMTGILTQTAESIPDRIRSLVYIAGQVCADGETMMEAVSGLDPEYTGHFLWAPDRRTAELSPQGARDFLYSLCPRRVVDEVVPRLTPEPVAPFATPIGSTAEQFGRVRRFYIECLRDRAFPVAVQRAMYSTVPFSRVYSIDCDHSPFFSAPEALTSIFDSIAKAD